jgi:hypothetical protein
VIFIQSFTPLLVWFLVLIIVIIQLPMPLGLIYATGARDSDFWFIVPPKGF